ncbi:hypothetical protein lerEdw1_003577 [Lerista edwardsae]|nr:hypothetical protein lerEdw1_003577 [Lerista edwardsae]
MNSLACSPTPFAWEPLAAPCCSSRALPGGARLGPGMEHQPLLKGDAAGPSKLPTRTLFLATCAAGIGGTFQYGYNVSVINAPTEASAGCPLTPHAERRESRAAVLHRAARGPATLPLPHIHKFLNETWRLRYRAELSPGMLTLLWSTIASIFSLGGFFGAHLGGCMAIRVGRKGALLLNNLLALLAAVLMGLSFPSGLFELLILGRFLIGMNTDRVGLALEGVPAVALWDCRSAQGRSPLPGMGLCVQPLYVGEAAPKHLRGALVMGSSIFLTGGILTGQVVGLRELLGGEKFWPFLLASSCFPALAQLLALPWFPESPRFLLIDRRDEAGCIRALKRFHGPWHCQQELEDIRRECLALRGEVPKRPWELFVDRGFRWQLVAVVLLTAGQQLSGINAIYFYAGYVLEEAGIPRGKIPYVTLGTGACECLTALTCGLLIESVGRRALILGGYSLMTLWCAVLTFSLTYQEFSWAPYLSMACVFAFILSFGLGPGGVTNTLTTELFTQSSRPAAYMIAGSVSWLSFFTIGMLFPFIVRGLRQYCFLVFLLECGLVAVFIFAVLPETKHKTFLQIKRDFERLNFGRGGATERDGDLSERHQLRDTF